MTGQPAAHGGGEDESELQGNFGLTLGRCSCPADESSKMLLS